MGEATCKVSRDNLAYIIVSPQVLLNYPRVVAFPERPSQFRAGQQEQKYLAGRRFPLMERLLNMEFVLKFAGHHVDNC